MTRRLSRTAEDLLSALLAAVRAGDMEGVTAFLSLLAIEDPAAADRIVTVLKLAQGSGE